MSWQHQDNSGVPNGGFNSQHHSSASSSEWRCALCNASNVIKARVCRTCKASRLFADRSSPPQVIQALGTLLPPQQQLAMQHQLQQRHGQQQPQTNQQQQWTQGPNLGPGTSSSRCSSSSSSSSSLPISLQQRTQHQVRSSTSISSTSSYYSSSTKSLASLSGI